MGAVGNMPVSGCSSGLDGGNCTNSMEGNGTARIDPLPDRQSDDTSGSIFSPGDGPQSSLHASASGFTTGQSTVKGGPAAFTRRRLLLIHHSEWPERAHAAQYLRQGALRPLWSVDQHS